MVSPPKDQFRGRIVGVSIVITNATRFLGIGNNPMLGCTVACAVDVATALNKFQPQFATSDSSAILKLCEISFRGVSFFVQALQ